MVNGQVKKSVAVFFLLLYAAVMGHQLLPHHHGQEQDSCPLCILFAATALAVPACAILAALLIIYAIWYEASAPLRRCKHPVFALRGPPALSR